MSPFQALIVLVLDVAPAITGLIAGSRKGRRWTGFLLGLLLSWIGVIIIAVIPPTRAKLVQLERERLEIQREALG